MRANPNYKRALEMVQDARNRVARGVWYGKDMRSSADLCASDAVSMLTEACGVCFTLTEAIGDPADYLRLSLVQIIRTLDGSQPKDLPTALMALDYVLKCNHDVIAVGA